MAGKGGGVTLGFLKFVLGLDGLAFEQGLNLSSKQLKAAERNFVKTGQSISDLGGKLSLGITAPFAALVATAIPAANESAAALGQVNAALKSMGPVAGKSTEDLQKAAGALQSLSVFDDDDILKSVTANLLTFGKVSGDIFDRAQLAVVNLSARMGTDLQSATIMIGKALNDPAKGLAALARAGIQFTAEQKQQILAMNAAGNAAGVQSLMLAELERQFGGAAAAQRAASPTAASQEQWRTFQETVGAIVNKVLPPLTNLLTSALGAFNQLSPGMQTVVVAGAAIAAALGPVLIGFGAIVTTLAPVLAIVAGPAGLAGGFAALLPVLGPVALAVGAVAAAWVLFGDKIGPVLSGLWQSVQDVLGPKVIALFDAVSGALSNLWGGPFGSAVGVVIDVLGRLGAAYASVFGEVVIRAIGVMLDVVTGAFKGIGDIINFVVALVTGDFAGAWTAMKSYVQNAITTAINILNTLAPGAGNALAAMVAAIQNWLGTKLNAIWDGLKVKIEAVKGWFYGLYDAVVGHSYIPDMVDGIGASMMRLDTLMVGKAKSVTEKTKKLFEDMAGGAQATFDKLTAATKSFTTQRTANDQVDLGQVNDEITNWANSLPDVLVAPVEDSTTQVVEKFAEMAQNVMGSIRQLANDIENGDFLDIVQSVLDVITQVVKAVNGVKGGGGSSGGSGDYGGARATGGPVVPGKNYLVGENGPEFFSPGARGFITPNNDNGGRGGSGSRVQIVPSKYFDVVVDGRAQAVAEPMVQRGMVGASTGAQVGMARRNERRLA